MDSVLFYKYYMYKPSGSNIIIAIFKDKETEMQRGKVASFKLCC